MPETKEIIRRAIELVTGETMALLSMWEEEEEEPEMASELLALWAAYQRFPSHTALQHWAELDTIVQRDKDILCKMSLYRLVDAPRDIEDAILDQEARLDDASNSLLVEEAECEALKLFVEFDRADLAAWAIVQLVGGVEVPGLASLLGGMRRATRVFEVHIGALQGAAHYADGMQMAFRKFGKDALGADEALESTTRKHYVLWK